MTVLVTGGAGYVGSHCVRMLCERGYDVVVYDNLSTGHAGAVDKRANLVHADLSELSTLDDVMRDGIDAVMHFAGVLNVNESLEHPVNYYIQNVSNTLNLLRAMAWSSVKRIVFSSSCSVYGIPPTVPITEEMPCLPISPYGSSKLMVERILDDCSRAWGLGSTSLRYFNAAGASMSGKIGEAHPEEIHLIPLVVRAALDRNELVRVFGADYPTKDGSAVRDYIHVDDLASAHLAAIESQKEGVFRCFNVGTGWGTSVKEIIDIVRRVMRSEIRVDPAQRRPGDPPELYANPTKIQTELGWEPRYDIEDIIKSAAEWHAANPNGYEKDEEDDG